MRTAGFWVLWRRGCACWGRCLDGVFPVPVNVHSEGAASSRFGEFAKAMFDLADFRAADLGRPCAKSGVAWMEGGELSCSLGWGMRDDCLGEGVSGMRPPATLVVKTRPFVGVQTSTVAIA